MKILHRYIAKTIFSAILLITLVLIALYAFILFVDQLNDLGKGHYDAWHAMAYVFLSLPYQVYLFFPVASLLGVLVGLGFLANHRELIVIRSAGMSMTEITWVVFKAALVLIAIVTLLGELYVPELSRIARYMKLDAIMSGKAIRTSTGVWMRDKQDFILLGQVDSKTQVQQVLQFHFDKNHQLSWARHIEQANFEQEKWHAKGVRETIFENERTRVNTYQEMKWPVQINPLLLSTNNQSDEMNLTELHYYLKMNRHASQSLFTYRYTYIQRIIQPITTLVMMLLAIPFIFGPLRSSTMGAKLLIGVSVGFGFHLINQFFGPISQVLQWSPELSAIGPTVVFAMLGFILMKRTS